MFYGFELRNYGSDKVATAKIQTWGFKTAAHKSMGDIIDATSIIYTVWVEHDISYVTAELFTHSL